ncbi:sigma-54-dependent Fis family transcriptional regulator [bacterium]|nr:MAG: sigma-54-dependent Fis family transcriptional regulator [bacterium]
MAKKRILIVDDEQSIRNVLRDILEFENYQIDEASSGDEALLKVAKDSFDLMFLDIKMKGIDGMEVLEKLRKDEISVPVIMLSGHGTIETAMQATRLGAFDFMEKPPDLNRLLVSARNALEQGSLVQKNTKLRKKVNGVTEILGESRNIQHIKQTISKVAPTEARVLVTGENGTGKELVARWVHEQSRRNQAEFVAVNCAAIPTDLLESELFGHEKGAFTGADKQRIGKFELAHEGTLFLDEIGDMSMEAQAKVLRALQEGLITRVGGNERISVDVRVIAATNKDLQEEIEAGRFREDLYHRLAVIPIHVPPLRERKDDIPALAEAFLTNLTQNEISFVGKLFSPKALEKLKQFEWTGNVRELQNVVERLAILSAENEISESDVDILVRKRSKPNDLSAIMDEFRTFHDYKEFSESFFIRYKLDQNDWNISQTAEILGLQRSHLYQKIKKFNLERD